MSSLFAYLIDRELTTIEAQLHLPIGRPLIPAHLQPALKRFPGTEAQSENFEVLGQSRVHPSVPGARAAHLTLIGIGTGQMPHSLDPLVGLGLETQLMFPFT